MNAEVFKVLGDLLAPMADATTAFYNAGQKADVDARIADGKAWIKLYAPSEEGEQQVLEDYLVLMDVGATNLETARRVSDKIRRALRGSIRYPQAFRLRRLVMLEEDNFYRFQLAYRYTHKPSGGN